MASFNVDCGPEPFQFHFRQYTEVYCLHHTARSYQVARHMITRLSKILDTESVDMNAGPLERTPFWEAVRFINIDLVRLLVRSNHLVLRPGEEGVLAQVAKTQGNVEVRL
jgi:hypothetical protein